MGSFNSLGNFPYFLTPISHDYIMSAKQQIQLSYQLCYQLKFGRTFTSLVATMDSYVDVVFG